MIPCINNSTVANKALKDDLNYIITEELRLRGATGLKASVAIREITEEARARAWAKRQQNIRHVWKTKEIEDQMLSHPKGPEWGAYATIETDPFMAANRNGNYMNTAKVYQAVLYQAAGKDWIDLRDTWLGSVKSLFTDKSRRDLSQALIDHWSGKGTTNALAGKIAQGWDRVTSATVKHIRAAGGTLAEIKGYKPQPLSTERFFDRRVIGRNQVAVGLEEFVDDFIPAIDRSKPNPVTGKLWTDEELNMAAVEYYKTLITDGANKARPGFGKGGLEVAHSIGRVFHYSDEGWGKLMAKYGPTDLVQELFSYVDNAASDIAELQTWGPRPNAQREAIRGLLQTKGLTAEAERFNDLWTIASGANASAPGVGLLNVVPATRYAAMIAQLGRVVLASVVGDHKNALIRNIYNNASTRRYLGEVFSNLANSKDRFGFIQDQLGVWESGYQSMHSLMKRMGETHWVTSGAGARVGKVLNASGLGRLTDANRHAIQLGLEDNVARHIGKSFADMEKAAPDLAVKLREWGVDQVWDTLGKVPLREVDGQFGTRKVIDFTKLFEDHETAATVLKRYVVGETRNTIISNNVLGDRLLQLHVKGGTGVGETIRTGVQYMKFPAASFYAFWKPLFQGEGTRPITRAKIASAWLTSTLIGGVLHQWAKDITAGKEPEPLYTPDGDLNYKMIARGAFNQDLVPIVGMVVLRLLGWDDPTKWDSEKRNVYDNPAEVLTDLAPAVAFVKRTGKEVLYDPIASLIRDDGKVQEELAGSAREIVNQLGGWYGLNVWATGHAFGRLVLDNIERGISPDAHERRIDRQRARMDQLGQDYLWLAP